ncbi:hypothetical protein TELCIR_23719 [Teladorsagia circumcincta]|uniref:Uncharacterized protein n=1 Tax=Teladorsagia circumcincta TaxID=45464 RepID=A0A2G9TAA7_TELCI|nr:hypothetical protein TELCIR_23719 [Teladorsagia circumcincta]
METNGQTAAGASGAHRSQCLRRSNPVHSGDFGLYRSSKATLGFEKDAEPASLPKRPVPYAALPAVEKEFERLEANVVISKVNYSEWAALIVIVRKLNGSLRICADFSTGLNDAGPPSISTTSP